jgi:hypothetical protein
MATMHYDAEHRRIECPHCHSIMPLVGLERFEVEAGREADMVPCYRCRVCAHVFAPRDLNAVKPTA